MPGPVKSSSADDANERIRRLNNTEILNVIHGVMDFIQKNPKQLQSEGVFRIVGQDDRINNIIFGLASGQSVESPQTSIHDFVTAFKRMLNLRDKEHPLKHVPKGALNALQSKTQSNDPSITSEKKAQSIQTFIDTLAHSKSRQQQDVAEILYTLLHLSHRVKQHSGKNSMKASNIAICNAPAFQSVLTLRDYDETNLSKVAEETTIQNDILAVAIESGYYDVPFEQKYTLSIIAANDAKLFDLEQKAGLAKAGMEKKQKELDEKRKDLKEYKSRLEPLYEGQRIQNRSIAGIEAMLHKTPEQQEVEQTIKKLETEIKNLTRLTDGLRKNFIESQREIKSLRIEQERLHNLNHPVHPKWVVTKPETLSQQKKSMPDSSTAKSQAKSSSTWVSAKTVASSQQRESTTNKSNSESKVITPPRKQALLSGQPNHPKRNSTSLTDNKPPPIPPRPKRSKGG